MCRKITNKSTGYMDLSIGSTSTRSHRRNRLCASRGRTPAPGPAGQMGALPQRGRLARPAGEAGEDVSLLFERPYLRIGDIVDAGLAKLQTAEW